jgi:hypothetical protein
MRWYVDEEKKKKKKKKGRYRDEAARTVAPASTAVGDYCPITSI